MIPPDGRILYFGRDREQFGFFSHFHPSPITLDGCAWQTVEHYYQAQKSLAPSYRAAIRAAAHPGHAKRLAAAPDAPPRIAKGSWFQQNAATPRTDWPDIKLDIMRRADAAKYGQHLGLAERLLQTGTAELIEDSAAEPFWGIGRDGQGLNWAGRVLMEIRATLAGGQPS